MVVVNLAVEVVCGGVVVVWVLAVRWRVCGGGGSGAMVVVLGVDG